MAFALPLFAHLFDLFQDAGTARSRARQVAPARRVAAAAAPQALAPAVAAGSVSDNPRNRVHALQRSWGGPTRSASVQRPLRVVRVVEGRQARHGAGRMVISGRMADVCAELDRLAELETRH